jgi:hypothetical protein
VFEYLHEDMDNHEEVFSRIDALKNDELLSGDVHITERGEKVLNDVLSIAGEFDSLFEWLSTDRFSEFLKEIDANVAHVIKPDGRRDEFHIGSIMESLIFTDIGWRKVSDVLDRVAEDFDSVDIATSDELTSFVQDYLKEEYPLTNIPFRYDYFINSRDYIFLKDEKVVSLSRQYIEEDLNRFLPPFLEMTARQKSLLSNMVYEGIRLLTIPLVKELYERERIVIKREFFSQVEEFFVFQALPVLKKVYNRNEKEITTILQEMLDEALTHTELSLELLERKDITFLEYYIAAMDKVTEAMSVGLGRVPFFNVFGRLTQLARDAKHTEEMKFFSLEDHEKFLRHLNIVFRRSVALLDQWRSLYKKYHKRVLDEQGESWSIHLVEVRALIEQSAKALE